MAKFVLERLEPGMRLAADVTDRSGRVLLRAGLELTDKHLKILKTWGVTEASVESNDAETAPIIDPVRLAAVEAEVRQRFQHCDLGYEVTQSLLRHAITARASKSS